MVLAGDEPIAVELELEQPSVAGEGSILRLGEHWLDRGDVDHLPNGARPLDGVAKTGFRRDTGFHFLDGEPRQHRLFGELVAGAFYPRVALLDEEPIALALLDLHERPLAMELVPFQLEQELSLLQPLAPIFERDPFAAVPDDHAPGAIVPLRDDALEVAVLEGVIFDLHREALVVHVVRRALRDGP